ncbi:hypothetical protein ACQ4LE_006783 [Meloidogyne hapla]|uniref:Uncharacterized protein n=1 Tax=Meloidogyne hapla TaxID=6305 RepID=A0A1I8B7Y9_MELHA
MSDKSQDFGYSWINSSRSSSPSISFKENCSDCNKNKTLELILGKLELQNSLIKQHFSVSNKDLQKEKNLEELKNKIMQEKILALTEKVNDQQIMLQQMQLKFNDDKTEKDNEIHQPIKKLMSHLAYGYRISFNITLSPIN